MIVSLGTANRICLLGPLPWLVLHTWCWLHGERRMESSAPRTPAPSPQLILDTDMSQHFRIVGELEELRLKAHSRRQDGTQGVDSGAEGDARLPSVPSDSEVGARSDVYETPDVR